MLQPCSHDASRSYGVFLKVQSNALRLLRDAGGCSSTALGSLGPLGASDEGERRRAAPSVRLCSIATIAA